MHLGAFLRANACTIYTFFFFHSPPPFKMSVHATDSDISLHFQGIFPLIIQKLPFQKSLFN